MGKSSRHLLRWIVAKQLHRHLLPGQSTYYLRLLPAVPAGCCTNSILFCCSKSRWKLATSVVNKFDHLANCSSVCFLSIWREDRKSTRLNSSHVAISYA